MKIRYVLLIAIIAAAFGHRAGASAAETVYQNTTLICINKHGCIDFDKHPDLIGGGLVLEPTTETAEGAPDEKL